MRATHPTDHVHIQQDTPTTARPHGPCHHRTVWEDALGPWGPFLSLDGFVNDPKAAKRSPPAPKSHFLDLIIRICTFTPGFGTFHRCGGILETEVGSPWTLPTTPGHFFVPRNISLFNPRVPRDSHFTPKQAACFVLTCCWSKNTEITAMHDCDPPLRATQ